MRGALRQVYDEGKWTDESTNRRNEKNTAVSPGVFVFPSGFSQLLIMHFLSSHLGLQPHDEDMQREREREKMPHRPRDTRYTNYMRKKEFLEE